MQELDFTQWNRFWEHWEQTAEREPERRRELLERIGEQMTRSVRSAIAGSGLQDSRGIIGNRQNHHVGSKNGYVAVRADSMTVLAGGQRKTPINAGRLTNYLASGHRVRPPSGRSDSYRSRARMAYVPGFDFYRKAAEQVRGIAERETGEYLRDLTEELTK